MKAAGSTLRLFLAVWPGDSTRLALACSRDAWTWDAGAAPVRTEQLHLTLHFLGAVPSRRLPQLVDDLSVPFDRFALRLDRAQRWPNGVAVLAPTLVPRALLALHATLGERLARLGLRTELRPYRPHLTLARRADDSSAPARTAPVQWEVDDYALVESRSGTRDYVVLRRYASAGADAGAARGLRT